MKPSRKPVVIILILAVAFLNAPLALSDSAAAGQESREPKRFLTFGIFIGKIEEGARIFTPVRLLPFEHPDSLRHEFPNALQFHESEADMLVQLGQRIGLQLHTTLQRYPALPGKEWKYSEFALPRLDEFKKAEVRTLRQRDLPIPGLRAIYFRGAQPICFIVDTRHLTLAERSMTRATSMGLDLTRAQFLSAIDHLSASFKDEKPRILIEEARSTQP